MKIFAGLILTVFFSTNAFAQPINSETIFAKIKIIIWDCKNQFECQNGNTAFTYAIQLDLVKHLELPPIEFYGAEYEKNLDSIDKKLFMLNIKVQKDLDTTTGNFQYTISGTFIDQFEGRVSESSILIPANQKLAGSIYSISTGTYRDADKIKKATLEVSL